MQSRWDSPWGSPPRTSEDANIRIGDAERNEISELLSKHYSDGRLDAAEFQERLDRAMSAKTRADLSGLLVDLPRLQTPAEQAAALEPAPRRRPRVLRIVLFAVFSLWVLSIAAAVTRGFWWFGWIHLPWLVIGLIVLFLWSRDRRHRRWRYRRQFLDDRPQ
ncbi:MAG: DUF1707 domain-containing protein [Acidimicrobiales bacterium]|jgi:hypothetical protein